MAASLRSATGILSNRLPDCEILSNILTLEIETATLLVGGIDWLVWYWSTEQYDRRQGAHHHRLRDYEIPKEEIKMNKEYDSENGGGSEMSETKRSRWHISSDVRSVLTVVAVVLAGLAAVWGVAEYAVSRLEPRFDQIDMQFTQQNLRFDQQDARMDRIESTMAEGFRQSQAAMAEGFRLSHARMDRIESAMAEGFRLSHGRINRLEEKVDAIEAFLRQGRPPVGVQRDEATPAPVAKPGGFSATSSWPLLRDR